MSHLNSEIVAIATTVPAIDVTNKLAAASTKDAGLVKVGGISMQFKSAPASTKDAGRVKVGGATIQF